MKPACRFTDFHILLKHFICKSSPLPSITFPIPSALALNSVSRLVGSPNLTRTLSGSRFPGWWEGAVLLWLTPSVHSLFLAWGGFQEGRGQRQGLQMISHSLLACSKNSVCTIRHGCVGFSGDPFPPKQLCRAPGKLGSCPLLSWSLASATIYLLQVYPSPGSGDVFAHSSNHKP